METFGQRLQRLLRERNISNGELARRIGKSAAYISLIVNGKRLVDKLPNYDDMLAMAEALQVPVAELAGESPRPGQERQVAAPRAPYLTDEAMLLRLGATPVVEDGAPIIEEFSGTARTGQNFQVPQDYDDLIPRPKKSRKPAAVPHRYWLRVSGDCMATAINDGDVLLIDTKLPRVPVEIVVALRDEHEAHVKRLVERDGVQWLESNDGWSAPLDDHWRLLGVATVGQYRLR